MRPLILTSQEQREIGDVAMAATVRRICVQIVMALLLLFRGGRLRRQKRLSVVELKLILLSR